MEKNSQKILDSEIIFLYDAKMCNPNGDPDEENKPRMDYITNRNLVSDVRLKRYIRDYLQSKGLEIWISKLDDEIVDATKRLEALAGTYKTETHKEVDIKKPDKEFIDWLLKTLIDVRLFGATMPIKGGEERGGGVNFTGPVQFAWGYSLNPVEIVPSSSITSTFAGRGEEYGTIGKDWRVYYSFIAFYGIISSKRAEKTGLSLNDIKTLDNALIEAIPSEATTRSKLGQTPRLLMRVEYKEGAYIGDLRRYISLKAKNGFNLESIRDINEFELNIDELYKIFESNSERINSIYLWIHPELSIAEDKLKESKEDEKKLKDKIALLPHKEK
ncbi:MULTISPECIES: type I-B CRISPR-associated protein Cas7/Csh2 [Thermodesulfovibrio]|jgi:CRISPR-associated protein Csh2|uniref:type I-B CRISPR-associated protein Cas7/Csh2 n=1 Tax=Thermodesulfovibrio TaxID=28261 RepID=UPI0026209FE3|nr:type I-B CRISPR-associated protein Cas7/Csh2 [Thermodesulfovibrio sp.]